MSAIGFSAQAPLHKPRIVSVRTVRPQGNGGQEIIFEDQALQECRPGQFGMIWIPGIDEIPMSILPSLNKKSCGIVIRGTGAAAKALASAKQGDKLGVRGPYGNFFETKKARRILLAGGGTGLVPLVHLGEELSHAKKKITLVVGAKTKKDLILLDRIKRDAKKFNWKLLVGTDDGSYGKKALVPELAEDVLTKDSIDLVCTCGPEKMMRRIFEAGLKHNVPVHASLERVMKCGVGICGSCCIGPYLVCKDGPVFDYKTLRTLREFGTVSRDHSGKKIQI